MLGVVIARADPGEPSVLALIEALDSYANAIYPPEFNYLLDIEAMRQPQMHFFAAYAGSAAVGCGGCWLKSDYAEIKRIYVRPDARGLGVGRKIMARLEDEARAHGLLVLRLELGNNQPEALGLYRALGFVECGMFGDYGPNPYSVFMEKRL